MVSAFDNKPDGFTQDFDRLIDAPQSVSMETMAPLALVQHPLNPFSLDLSIGHTADHVNCPACLRANAAFVVSTADFGAMSFDDATTFWQLYRAQDPDLRARTHETTLGYIHALQKFFSSIRLRDITPGHLRQYQIARLHNSISIQGQENHPWKQKAGHSMINHELSVLGQMMTLAKLWHRLKPYYFPLKQKSWSPREILTEEDEELLWEIAARHPEAALAYWVAVITNNTTASGMELRGLRLKNLFLTSVIGEIYIPEESCKNNTRPRRLPLNNIARWAVGECLKRALKLGCCEPTHYLFPFWIRRNKYDPTRPASRFFLRKSWAKLQAATGFVDLNPHDLRHHCITRMLENDVNPETVIAIAGHVGRKMMEYYAHQRRRVKYAAVLTIEAKTKTPTAAAGARKAG